MPGRIEDETDAAKESDTPRARSGLGGKIVLALGSIVFAVILVEGLLWLQEPYFNVLRRSSVAALGEYRTHPVWHHWRTPGQLRAAFLPTREHPDPVIIRTNAHGCRVHRPMEMRGADGTRRILVLGDSFTEGYYEQQMFSAILERKLNERASDTRYEVINCGTSSYSPMLHYLRYAHQLRDLRPDELIVNIDLTDVYDDNHRYRPLATFSESGEPLTAGESEPRLQRFANALRYRFRTARLLLGLPRRTGAPPMAQNVFRYHTEQAPHSAEWEDDVGFTLSVLSHLVELTKRDGVVLALTMYPYEAQLKARGEEALWNRDFEQRVRQFAQDRGVRFYSAYDDMRRQYDNGVPLYWSNDFHYQPIGQQVWGESFAHHYISNWMEN